MKLSDYYNTPLPNPLPNLTNLIVGWSFQQPILSFPPTLVYLEFRNGSDFNHPLPQLPNTLKYLKFRGCFNQTISYLPPRLKYLSFSDSFTQKLPNPLPSTLKKLKLGRYYEHEIDFIPQLVHLKIARYPTTSLPLSLTHLSLFAYHNEVLAPSIIHLKIIDEISDQHENLATSNVSQLQFSEDFNRQVCHFPCNLTWLRFGGSFNAEITPSLLPHTLTYLEFGVSFFQPVRDLPPNLTKLMFNGVFHRDSDISNLKHLTYLSYSTKYIKNENCYKVKIPIPSNLRLVFEHKEEYGFVIDGSIYLERYVYSSEGRITFFIY